MTSRHIAAHIVSVSGGKDSTALYLLALERQEAKGRPFIPVFADTGNEHEAVYEAIADLPRLTGGPPVQVVKADLSARVLAKREVVTHKWRAEGVPEEILAQALAVLVPTGNPFLDLALWKGRFPSTKARFCTQELKVYPIADQVFAPLHAQGRRLVAWQGVRAQESRARALLKPWQRLDQASMPVLAYRPLLTWTLEDVWAMHARHNVPRNRLYELGMGRVGYMPCIMARKDEIRTIAARFPEHVDRIERWERLVSAAARRGASTFFSYDKTPGAHVADLSLPMPGVRAVVEWSRTSRGGLQGDFMLDPAIEFGTACNQWGACE